MSFIILVSFVTIPVLVIAEEDIRAAYFVSCSLVFVICMSVLGFIFGPKIWAGAHQEVTQAAIRKTVDSHKMQSTFTTGTDDAMSVNTATHEGALILEHPKKVATMKEELKELQRLKREWDKDHKERAKVQVQEINIGTGNGRGLSKEVSSLGRLDVSSEMLLPPEQAKGQGEEQ